MGTNFRATFSGSAEAVAVMQETGGTVSNYQSLHNKPKINGVELSGDMPAEDLGITSDRRYTHTQAQAAKVWVITHGLGKRPAVTVVDSAGTVVVGEIEYLDDNTVRLTFCAPFSGFAYFN